MVIVVKGRRSARQRGAPNGTEGAEKGEDNSSIRRAEAPPLSALPPVAKQERRRQGVLYEKDQEEWPHPRQPPVACRELLYGFLCGEFPAVGTSQEGSLLFPLRSALHYRRMVGGPPLLARCLCAAVTVSSVARQCEQTNQPLLVWSVCVRVVGASVERERKTKVRGAAGHCGSVRKDGTTVAQRLSS